ncbi:uncharacterized protein N0V89_005409 [Didymosphaeria variabile]|uniref:F-box domain-containing protein n=1 Tax=Didymosphaeria variabile TaxID=1932322 RepID=A0A9W9CBG1_9PLEO|nr:uncharacterized protein N0V89_005409 [Didymosphaeria variabile]KAJ4353679.1 hypothetical protein N0V89_005409 [Didymosphaeria variabile]
MSNPDSLPAKTSITPISSSSRQTARALNLTFLCLPKHIRRLIYEQLPARTKYISGYRGESNDQVYKNKPVVILVLRYVERTILQTCRQIATEAEPILEIKTMKLGPPCLIVAAEYFHRIPHDIRFLRRMQDDELWQRLKITKEHRSDKDLNDQRILMWARIMHLNLLSSKIIRIGIFIRKYEQLEEGNPFLEKLADSAKKIEEQQWGSSGSRRRRPLYEVAVEWEGSTKANSATDTLLGEGLLASSAVNGHTLSVFIKGEHAFEREGDYIRDKKTRKKVAYVPRKPSTQAQEPGPGASGQVPAANPNAGGSQQPPAQFGTQIGGSNRTVGGFQTDQPQFFGQGSNRSGGAGTVNTKWDDGKWSPKWAIEHAKWF